jgi:DNA-binding transcriptional ArsR family regulator
VLANRTRLRVLQLLLEQPGLTVSAVAMRLKLTLPVASQSLRALEARGVLTARRTGRQVAYRPSTDTASPTSGLAAAARRVFQCEPALVETLFKLATAFTHPRRTEIFRAVREQVGTPGELQAATHIPGRFLMRHRRKLQARGFLAVQQGQSVAVERSDAFGRELGRMAAR